ncbi:hypothetical protein [Treponema sp. J25]|uniref:hypothetical protein n=1 Tax=Treponema sp. J25 TaxID=2094121 RepID=UPI00104654E9|nr:hypothetical protein [Treponema sp. J25]TCW61973.1 hypothetical protein C5O22_04405 [Treponema sp. J25]HOM23170.1 hypothetical protein [Termitinemataceae bacterium]
MSKYFIENRKIYLELFIWILVFFFISFLCWCQVRLGTNLVITPKEYLLITNNFLLSFFIFYIIVNEILYFSQDYLYGYIYVYLESLKSRKKYYAFKLKASVLKWLVIYGLITLLSLMIAPQFKSEIGILIENTTIDIYNLYSRYLMQQIPFILLMVLVMQLGGMIVIIKNDSIFLSLMTGCALLIVSVFLEAYFPLYKYFMFGGISCFFEYASIQSKLCVYGVNVVFLLLCNIVMYYLNVFLLERKDILWRISVK